MRGTTRNTGRRPPRSDWGGSTVITCTTTTSTFEITGANPRINRSMVTGGSTITATSVAAIVKIAIAMGGGVIAIPIQFQVWGGSPHCYEYCDEYAQVLGVVALLRVRALAPALGCALVLVILLPCSHSISTTQRCRRGAAATSTTSSSSARRMWRRRAAMAPTDVWMCETASATPALKRRGR